MIFAVYNCRIIIRKKWYFGDFGLYMALEFKICKNQLNLVELNSWFLSVNFCPKKTFNVSLCIYIYIYNKYQFVIMLIWQGDES